MKAIAIIFALLYSASVEGSPMPSPEAKCLNTLLNQHYSSLQDASLTLGYTPLCQENGILLQPVQCSDEEEEWCFCVNPVTGRAIEGTGFVSTSEETHNCEAAISELGQCHVALINYHNFIDENPNVRDSPFGYIPDCTELGGYFKAMQRNENFFFCVAQSNGEIIPETRVDSSNERPISEAICDEYAYLWREFHYEHNETEATSETTLIQWRAYLVDFSSSLPQTSEMNEQNGKTPHKPFVVVDGNPDVNTDELAEEQGRGKKEGESSVTSTPSESAEKVPSVPDLSFENSYNPFEDSKYYEHYEGDQQDSMGTASETTSPEYQSESNAGRFVRSLDIGDPSPSNESEAISKARKYIQSLDIGGPSLSNEDEAISKARKYIQSLDIGDPSLSNESEAISEARKYIQSLDIGGPSLSNEDEAISKARKYIQSLDIGGPSLSNEDEAISKARKYIQSLDLGGAESEEERFIQSLDINEL